MKDLPMALRQRVEEAGKDGEWAEKVHCAATWETYEKLLAEKGIKATAELKETFDVNGFMNKTGRLEDNDLEKVAGGLEFSNIYDCPPYHDPFLCEMTPCPHIKTKDNTPDENHYDRYCDLYYWCFNLTYPKRQ